MTSSTRRALWLVPTLILFTSACGEDTTTTPTDTSATPAAATVTATANPTVVTASASGDAAYTWSGAFTVTVTNTNTTPLTIRSITADLQQASGGIVITPVTGTDESFRFDVRAPGNRIDVNANMVIPFTFYYSLPNGGRESLVSLSFAVATDEGASGSITASVIIQ